MWSVTDHIPDLSGQTVVITGCSSGLGMHVARQLLQRNATIVMACRNAEKMSNVAERMVSELKLSSSRIHQLVLDVADLESVRAFPAALADVGVRAIDALVLNAGIAMSTLEKSPQGLELTFATNLVGHWLLTGLLLPLLKAGTEARVVLVSSLAHLAASSVDYEILRGESEARTFIGWHVYMQTKLGMHWVAEGLNRRLTEANLKAMGTTAHPGYAMSEMTDPRSVKNVGGGLEQKWMHVLGRPWKQSGEQGAWPISLAAGSTPVVNGEYFGPGGFLGMWGEPMGGARRAAAVEDREKQEELWRECEKVTGFSYKL